MAATSTLLHTGRSMRLSGLKATYTADYRVVTNAGTDSPYAALTQAQAASPDAVPALYATYSLSGSADTSSYAQDFSVNLENPNIRDQWIISVTWRPLDPNQTASDATTVPASRAPRYSLEFWETEEIISSGWNVAALTSGTTWRAADTAGPLVNAAGDQFYDALSEEDKVVVLVAHVNFSSLSDICTYHRAFNRTVNSDTYRGYTAHKAKFIGIEAGELTYEKVSGTTYAFYPCTIKVAFKDSEWYTPIVNKGMKARPSAGAAVQSVGIKIDNHAITEPVLLAADGTVLAKGSGVVGNVINYRTRRAVVYTGAYPATGLGLD